VKKLNQYQGGALSWDLTNGIVELALHREPTNEIGLPTLEELEQFECFLAAAGGTARALIIHSSLPAGFSAGADLRELYAQGHTMNVEDWVSGIRGFLERIHRILNSLDSSPLVTIAAVHGVCFGGGFELALTCDLIIADRMARFCFPELRLGLIPGFGGIPRLKRDTGNGIVRDLLMTGRSINAVKALSAGLVSQVTAEGCALQVARATAAQAIKLDGLALAAAKLFAKPIPADETKREIEIFCELIRRPEAYQRLKKFVESKDVLPYLP
jgi:enoyl-CoA hydratase/carnithine racemase